MASRNEEIERTTEITRTTVERRIARRTTITGSPYQVEQEMKRLQQKGGKR